MGCFIVSGPGIKNSGKIKDIDIRQVAPTILKLMKLKIPKEIKVKTINQILE